MIKAANALAKAGENPNLKSSRSITIRDNQIMRDSNPSPTTRRTRQSKKESHFSSTKDGSKKKRKGGSLDKEAKEQFKAIDAKLDDLRQKCFGEINRLEAMLEKDGNENQVQLEILESHVGTKVESLAEQNKEFGQNIGIVNGTVKQLVDSVKSCQAVIRQMKENSPEAALNNL